MIGSTYDDWLTTEPRQEELDALDAEATCDHCGGPVGPACAGHPRYEARAGMCDWDVIRLSDGKVVATESNFHRASKRIAHLLKEGE